MVAKLSVCVGGNRTEWLRGLCLGEGLPLPLNISAFWLQLFSAAVVSSGAVSGFGPSLSEVGVRDGGVPYEIQKKIAVLIFTVTAYLLSRGGGDERLPFIL